MASSIQLLRSTIAKERPFSGNLLEGQPAININAIEPGLFFKASDGSLVKIGPASITSDGAPPNSNGAGEQGNCPGELWLDKSVNPAVLKIYDGSEWIDAGSGGGGGSEPGVVTLQRWIKTAVGGETSFSGPDDSSQILTYTPGLEEVFLNGVLLTRGEDYVASSGTSITSLSPLTSGDEITVLGWSPFEVMGPIDGDSLLDGTVTSEKLANGTIVDEDVNPNAAISSTKLAYEPFGDGAVNRTVNSKLRDVINVRDYGALGNNSADDTEAIKAAIAAANAQTVAYGRFVLKPRPNENFLIGGRPTVYFPKGTYRISDELPFGFYSTFKGEDAIIYQTDATKNIFSSFTPYLINFEGLSFVGGNTHIFVQNGPTGQGGLEGTLIHISNCQFQASESYAIQTQSTFPFGGMQLIVEKCRFRTNLDIYAAHDQVTVRDCWIGTYSSVPGQPSDSALFVFKANVSFLDNALIPGLDYSSPTDTRRYIDAYGSILISGNRFGAEGGGGMPIVYSFHDQSLSSIYPYQGPGISIVNNFILADGSSARLDKGIVVLKRGLPQVINIEGNSFTFNSTFIRTDQMSGDYTTLSDYLDNAFLPTPEKPFQANAKRFTFRIKNNAGWAASITQSPTDTALLEQYMEWDNFSSTSKVSSFNRLTSKDISAQSIISANYEQTGTSGTTSIVDTGITKDTEFLGFSNSAIYDVYITGNPNAAGNQVNRAPIWGSITVGGESFGGNLVYRVQYENMTNPTWASLSNFTVSAVFWDGASESQTILTSSTAQLRIRIDGYASFTGNSQQVRITRRL